jgi:hypothetical protein
VRETMHAAVLLQAAVVVAVMNGARRHWDVWGA